MYQVYLIRRLTDNRAVFAGRYRTGNDGAATKMKAMTAAYGECSLEMVMVAENATVASRIVGEIVNSNLIYDLPRLNGKARKAKSKVEQPTVRRVRVKFGDGEPFNRYVNASK